eukprot:gene34537-46345_t
MTDASSNCAGRSKRRDEWIVLGSALFTVALSLADVKNRLKVLRAERDWSQAELGGRLGVSRQAVNAIETGKYDPSLPLAFRIGRQAMTMREIGPGEAAARARSRRVMLYFAVLAAIGGVIGFVT